MIKLLSAFFSVLEQIGQYFSNKQLIDAGKAESTLSQIEEVEKRVELAEKVLATPDADRDKRLRGRFSRKDSE